MQVFEDIVTENSKPFAIALIAISYLLPVGLVIGYWLHLLTR